MPTIPKPSIYSLGIGRENKRREQGPHICCHHDQVRLELELTSGAVPPTRRRTVELLHEMEMWDASESKSLRNITDQTQMPSAARTNPVSTTSCAAKCFINLLSKQTVLDIGKRNRAGERSSPVADLEANGL